MALAAAALALTAALLPACSPSQEADAGLKGSIRIDGSSTVVRITEAVDEQFHKVAPNVRVSVGISGTGGGFKKFATGQIDIADASRPIKQSELEAAAAKGIAFVELPVAYDGLTLVVNPQNTWVEQLTVEQIRKIFTADNPAKTWKEVHPSWPDELIRIYSPGTDSGTFDYFKEVVVGRGAIRPDMSVSEDDNVLVRGIEGDRNAIGFFGYAYYAANNEVLRSIPVVNPATGQPVAPTLATIEDGSYAPFSRPLFIYVNKAALEQPHVLAFCEFYLQHAGELSREVGYIGLPEALYARVLANLKAGRTGTQFLTEDGKHREGSLADLYQ